MKRFISSNDRDDEGWEEPDFEEEKSEKDDEEPVNANDGGPGQGKKINKPPTGEELRAIKDATDLFRSNSFKLQVSVLCPPSPAHRI